MPLLKNYKGEYVVQAFNPFSLNWFFENAPSIPRGQLSGDFRDEDDMAFYKKFLLSNLFLNSKSKPDYVAYDIKCLPQWRVSAFKRKKPVLAWTITNVEEQKNAITLCDNYIFEGLSQAEIS